MEKAQEETLQRDCPAGALALAKAVGPISGDKGH